MNLHPPRNLGTQTLPPLDTNVWLMCEALMHRCWRREKISIWTSFLTPLPDTASRCRIKAVFIVLRILCWMLLHCCCWGPDSAESILTLFSADRMNFQTLNLYKRQLVIWGGGVGRTGNLSSISEQPMLLRESVSLSWLFYCPSQCRCYFLCPNITPLPHSMIHSFISRTTGPIWSKMSQLCRELEGCSRMLYLSSQIGKRTSSSSCPVSNAILIPPDCRSRHTHNGLCVVNMLRGWEVFQCNHLLLFTAYLEVRGSEKACCIKLRLGLVVDSLFLHGGEKRGRREPMMGPECQAKANCGSRFGSWPRKIWIPHSCAQTENAHPVRVDSGSS